MTSWALSPGATACPSTGRTVPTPPRKSGRSSRIVGFASHGAADTNDSYPTTIEAVCKDRLNLLLDISAALSSTKTFVLGLNTRSTEDGFAIIRWRSALRTGPS